MAKEYSKEEKEKIAQQAAAKTAAWEEAQARAKAIRERRSQLNSGSEDLYKYSGDKRAAAIKGLEREFSARQAEDDKYDRLRRNSKRTADQEKEYQSLKEKRDREAADWKLKERTLEGLKEGKDLEGLEAMTASSAAFIQAKRDWEQAARKELKNVDAVDLVVTRAQDRRVNQGTYENGETMAQDMVNLGGQAHIIGPNGIITSDKNYYEAWKKLIQGNFGAKATFNDGLDRGKYAEYGNNYFMLYTYYPGFEGFLTADGVMQEMPAISMSTEWENSPAASVGEELDKALNNEFLEFCAMKTTNANTPIMRRKDALTARCYKDTGDISFQLKFRVYPGQKVGTQALTTAQEWLLLLSMTTPINAACSFSVDNAIGTVVKAADGIAAAFKAVKDGISGTNSKDKEKQQQQQAALVRAEATLGAEGATALKSFENADARITNPNVFGACLFGIRLYPWIFKKPLTCYISSWSVTPSKEWNEDQFVNDHYYYDFTLNCSMDQKPCANVWRFDYFKV